MDEVHAAPSTRRRRFVAARRLPLHLTPRCGMQPPPPPTAGPAGLLYGQVAHRLDCVNGGDAAAAHMVIAGDERPPVPTEGRTPPSASSTNGLNNGAPSAAATERSRGIRRGSATRVFPLADAQPREPALSACNCRSSRDKRVGCAAISNVAVVVVNSATGIPDEHSGPSANLSDGSAQV